MASVAAMKPGQRVLEMGREGVRVSMFSRCVRVWDIRVCEGMCSVLGLGFEFGFGFWEGGGRVCERARRKNRITL